MKKILLIISLLATFAFTNVYAEELPEVTDKDKVKVYLFRGDGCGHCKNAIQYFNDLEGKYDDYIEFVIFETYHNEDNDSIMKKVKTEFDVEESKMSSVPYLVVGDYDQVGFNESVGDKIIEEALKAYEDEDYNDEVADIIKGEDYEAETLKEAADAESIPYWETGDKEKVTLYFFRGDGCDYCQLALIYINELEGKYDDIVDIVIFETNNNTANRELAYDVKEHFDVDSASMDSIPYFVIGDYDQIGFNDALGDALFEEIVDAYNSEDYVDVVAPILANHSPTSENLELASIHDGVDYWDAETDIVEVLIIVGIFAVVIGGIGALIFVPTKKR